jgi:hypothetical protein
MKTLYIVRSNPNESRGQEFNDWYDNVHFPEVMKVEGFLSAERFELNAVNSWGEQPYRYLAIYEIDSDNVAGTIENIKNAGLNMSAAIDLANVHVSVFGAVGTPLEK